MKNIENGREENEKTRQTHHRPLLSGIRKQGLAVAGSYSPCRLREGRQHQQQNSNLIGKFTREKTLGMGGKKMEKPDKLTITHFSLEFVRGGWQRWALILFRLREGCQCCQQNNNLIEKSPVRKHWEREGRKWKNQTNSP